MQAQTNCLCLASAEWQIALQFGREGLQVCTKGALIVQGVENVYTQHTPMLLTTLEALVKGRLKDADFPYIDRAYNGAAPAKVPKVGARQSDDCICHPVEHQAFQCCQQRRSLSANLCSIWTCCREAGYRRMLCLLLLALWMREWQPEVIGMCDAEHGMLQLISFRFHQGWRHSQEDATSRPIAAPTSIFIYSASAVPGNEHTQMWDMVCCSSS